MLFELGAAAALGARNARWGANCDVYGRTRYAWKAEPEVGAQNTLVWVHDWASAGSNGFATGTGLTVYGVRRR